MLLLGLLFAFLREAIRSIRMDQAAGCRPFAYLVEVPISKEHESLQVVPIKDEIRLGRGPSNDLVIEDPFVSLSHARIYLEKEQFWLEDLGSTNRTYVNGELVNGPQRLEQVAIITLGNAVVVFHTSPNSPVGKG